MSRKSEHLRNAQGHNRHAQNQLNEIERLNNLKKTATWQGVLFVLFIFPVIPAISLAILYYIMEEGGQLSYIGFIILILQLSGACAYRFYKEINYKINENREQNQ